MESTDITLKAILEESESGEFLLPNFQRSYVWDVTKQKRLVASFLLKYPIGGILLLNEKKNIYSLRELCKISNNNFDDESEITLLLDGQQRISTLKSVFSDLFDSENESTLNSKVLSYHSRLRKRWFFKIFDNDGADDLFGLKRLAFKQEKLDNIEPEELIDYLEPFNFSNKSPQRTNKKSPYYRFSDGYEYSEVINNCASEYLVPLFEIFNSTKRKSLHDNVLKSISKNRILNMQSELSDGEIYKLLKPLDIESKLSSKADLNRLKEYVNNLWNELGNDWHRNVLNYFDSFINNKISSLKISSKDSNKAFAIFQEINLGGTKLDDFDLISAKVSKNYKTSSFSKYIVDKINDPLELPNSINGYITKSSSRPSTFNILSMNVKSDETPVGLFRKALLYMLSILNNVEYGKLVDSEENDLIKPDLIRSKYILKLSAESVSVHIDDVIISLQRAFAFLQIRCGIVFSENIPYDLMIIPIAYILYEDTAWEDERVINKLEYWYWGSIFSARYRANQNSVAISDVKRLYEWIFKDNYKEYFKKFREKVLNIPDFSDFNTLSLQNEEENVPKAIYLSLLQYTLSLLPRDLHPSEEFIITAWDAANETKVTVEGTSKSSTDDSFILKLEDHHIYPLAVAAELNESTKSIRSKKGHCLNSPLNRTYISSAANSIISSHSPTKYLNELTEAMKGDHMISSVDVYKSLIDAGEDKESKYTEVLKQRFDKLQTKLDTELSDLTI